MKVTFDNIYWRDFDDEKTLLTAFGLQDLLGDICNITYGFNSHRCEIHCTENNFACHVYGFKHTTIGLERTALLFATPEGKIGEIVIFPNGKVAVVIENIKAPEWAINRQRDFVI